MLYKALTEMMWPVSRIRFIRHTMHVLKFGGLGREHGTKGVAVFLRRVLPIGPFLHQHSISYLSTAGEARAPPLNNLRLDFLRVYAQVFNGFGHHLAGDKIFFRERVKGADDS